MNVVLPVFLVDYLDKGRVRGSEGQWERVERESGERREDREREGRERGERGERGKWEAES